MTRWPPHTRQCIASRLPSIRPLIRSLILFLLTADRVARRAIAGVLNDADGTFLPRYLRLPGRRVRIWRGTRGEDCCRRDQQEDQPSYARRLFHGVPNHLKSASTIVCAFGNQGAHLIEHGCIHLLPDALLPALCVLASAAARARDWPRCEPPGPGATPLLLYGRRKYAAPCRRRPVTPPAPCRSSSCGSTETTRGSRLQGSA